MKRLALLLAACLVLFGCSKKAEQSEPLKQLEQPEEAAEPAEVRIVSVGGTVTEIVFELGLGAHVVGVDTSSLYPPDAIQNLPKVGYQRQLSTEGILSLRPTLVLATSEAGPPPVLEQLRAAGVRLEIVPEAWSVEGTKEKVRAVARAIDRVEAGEALAARIEKEVEKARAKWKDVTSRPRVLPIYARGPNHLLIFGKNTAADAMLALASADNAAAQIEGAKPLTPEAVVQAAPEVVLVPSRGLDSTGDIDGLLKVPGLAATPAGEAKRVVSMDDLLLLGFGPRLGLAVAQLGELLHGARNAQ